MKPLDKCFKEIEERMIEAGEHKLHLDNAIRPILKIDNSIDYYKKKILELEDEKELELRKVSDLFELAMVSTHSLKNGYTVKVDNRYKIEIKNVRAFLGWLKVNADPENVLELFATGLKKTVIYKYASKEINNMRIRGEMEPKIDGLEIYDITYRKLTTKRNQK